MKLTLRQRHRLARRYQSGEDAVVLAREYGIHRTHVTRIARNVKLKPLPARISWVERLERLRSAGKLTEYFFKLS